MLSCGDIYNECNYARPHDQRCEALCGLCQDNNRRYLYVAIKMKNPLLLWYKLSNIYEIFHGKYMVFIHE